MNQKMIMGIINIFIKFISIDKFFFQLQLFVKKFIVKL